MSRGLDIRILLFLVFSFLSCLVYLLNTNDTNFQGPKCIITFSVVLPSKCEFLVPFLAFFKIIWSRTPLKKSEISECKIKHFSGLLRNRHFVNSLVGRGLDIRIFLFFLFSLMFSVLAEHQ